jgi:signal transduction histidine kinase
MPTNHRRRRAPLTVAQSVLALEAALSGLLCFVMVLIWAATGAGYFWPMWVAFGLGVPLGLQVAAQVGLRVARRPVRPLAVQAAVSAAIAVICVVIWLMTGAPAPFWPFWPILGLSLALALHALTFGLWEHLRRPAREQALAARVDVLTRTRRGALDVQAAELRRIERDLHDGAQARLVALSMQLGRAEERLRDQPEAAELVRQARGEAGAAIAELRDLARGIAPPVLADRGLPAAVEALGRRAPIPVTVEAELDHRPLPVLETAAYFVVAEALTNVAKHAPQAHAAVSIRMDATHLYVEVADDGPGGADIHGGGLSGLRSRVEALDGMLLVVSERGEGTIVRAELPCA